MSLLGGKPVLENAITVKTLKQRLMACAHCDAHLSPEWEFRCFAFDPDWHVETGEKMGSFRDGQGLEGFFVFLDGGCIGKVNGAQIQMAPAVGAKDVPASFRHFFDEPAFDGAPTSFLVWGQYAEDKLNFQGLRAEQPEIFSILAKGFDAYYAWAVEYYEKKIDRAALKRMFDSRDTY